jgi:hypothetical protein
MNCMHNGVKGEVRKGYFEIVCMKWEKVEFLLIVIVK